MNITYQNQVTLNKQRNKCIIFHTFTYLNLEHHRNSAQYKLHGLHLVVKFIVKNISDDDEGLNYVNIKLHNSNHVCHGLMIQ